MPPLRQQKKHKKWLNLYRQYYGIHKPYNVLGKLIIIIIFFFFKSSLNSLIDYSYVSFSVEPVFLKEARRRKLAIKDHLQRVFLQTAFPGALIRIRLGHPLLTMTSDYKMHANVPKRSRHKGGRVGRS